jgi:hypothetical protein
VLVRRDRLFTGPYFILRLYCLPYAASGRLLYTIRSAIPQPISARLDNRFAWTARMRSVMTSPHEAVLPKTK